MVDLNSPIGKLTWKEAALYALKSNEINVGQHYLLYIERRSDKGINILNSICTKHDIYLDTYTFDIDMEQKLDSVFRDLQLNFMEISSKLINKKKVMVLANR